MLLIRERVGSAGLFQKCYDTQTEAVPLWRFSFTPSIATWEPLTYRLRYDLLPKTGLQYGVVKPVIQLGPAQSHVADKLLQFRSMKIFA